MAPLNRRMFLKALAGIPLAAVAATEAAAYAQAGALLDAQPCPLQDSRDVFSEFAYKRYFYIEGVYEMDPTTRRNKQPLRLQRFCVSDVAAESPTAWCRFTALP